MTERLDPNYKLLQEFAGIKTELDIVKNENKQLKGEKGIPFAWWKECPGLAQKTMERTIDRNERLLVINDELQSQLTAAEKGQCAFKGGELCAGCQVEILKEQLTTAQERENELREH